MKKILSCVLALVMLFAFTACGGAQKLEGVEAPVDVLNTVWNSYGETDKFFAMGGDYTNMVDNAPGAVDITDTDTMQALFACPADAVAMVDGAASLLHAMNANNFTAVAYHLADGVKADDFVAAAKAGVEAQQWLCGAPEQLSIAPLSTEYVVVAYGAADLVAAFEGYLSASFASTVFTVQQPLNV